ncbi:hypothetical protein CC1G_14995 [Coprinopsis cinerea okayama7|uniref:Histidine-specific methyltransferase SAM-dependent domain-containing protein n=1 Tax=Coprinopsis cinerea (strain Okayama-7 / 130 / ATCC MYA-4618 / FGSC 9003) TaxID=240176 RepID=D6RP19_COPC7|nr:hypothetical protein CC1G_14995 [Coprinopsis cinerea okayama7\|eukprot:XP_002910664.1 hypothetical protein CC1G_14995 [Coprinopsis cinerea okayama7\
MLLYDEEGLRLYDAITTSAPEYYPFTAEEEILKNHSEEIVTIMRSQTKHGISCPQVVLELGSGYWALDLEKRELERTLNGIVTSDLGQKLEGRVNTKGIWGTYEDGIRFIKDGGLIPGYTAESTGGQTQLHIMFLGSSLGNFPRKEAGPFLRSLPLRAGACDTLLLGLDHDNDVDKIEVAYNDPQGYTRRFKMNALRHAGRVLGDEQFFREDDWERSYDDLGRKTT